MVKKRFIQCFLCFFVLFTAFFIRLSLSVAIVAMTDKSKANPDFEELNWDLKTRSEILSAFSWGNVVMQVPAGQLGQMFSVRYLLLVANAVCAVLSLVTPWAAIHGGWLAVFIIRIGQGLCQGFYFPLVYNLASKWAPLEERNRFIGYALNGATLGAVMSVALSGVLASSPLGWPSVFYLAGTIGLLWTVLWWWQGADSPLTHSTIEPEERDHLRKSLAEVSHSESFPTPWKAILTSPPVLALVATHISCGWGHTVVTTQVPAYLNSVLGFSITANGFVSALTYFCPWVCAFPICWIADFLIERKAFSVGTVRKIATTISLGVYGLVILALCLVDRNAIVAVAMLTTAVTLSTFMFCGFFINQLDLSPNFAGVLMGISNALENVSGIFATLSVGWIVKDPNSVTDWRWVFATVALVSVLGNVIFVLFGSGNVQKWNSPIASEKKQDKKPVID